MNDTSDLVRHAAHRASAAEMRQRHEALITIVMEIQPCTVRQAFYQSVVFRWKDYRAKGRTRNKTMTLAAEEFMRRFLLHVLPGRFHRIRHYGLLANVARNHNLALARALLHQPPPQAASAEQTSACGSARPLFVCRHCGAPMTIVETLARAQRIHALPVQPGAP